MVSSSKVSSEATPNLTQADQIEMVDKKRHDPS
jgi:hypothetical protein